MKKISVILLTLFLIGTLVGCGASAAGTESSAASENTSGAASDSTETTAAESTLADGIYTVEVDTDSTMFTFNEAVDGKGTLTVEDGVMTVHISLVSQNIVNLYLGTAEDAAKDGAELIEPTLDTVTYSDGYSEEVYGFDIPVSALDTEIDVAIIGTKGTWYDHVITVSEPVPADLTDGEYSVNVLLEGGSGKAGIASPATLIVSGGEYYARIEWSSENYDYMIVDEVTYYPVNESGNSVFEIPVSGFYEAIDVVADTTAMSTPHEIEYTLTFTFY